MFNKALLVLASLSILLPTRAHAELAANVGWASDYFYRGIFQARSSASGGIDYSGSGFYAGAWAADVDDGLEVDGYFGYGREIAGVSLSAGLTGYYYTQGFDDTYQEFNLGAGIGVLSVDVAIGEYGNFDGPTQRYNWYALTLEKYGFHGRVAGFSRDFDGHYLELGYSRALAELELGLTLIVADDDLAGGSTESLILSIGKSFDIDWSEAP